MPSDQGCIQDWGRKNGKVRQREVVGEVGDGGDQAGRN
jgi:hypothetical protein